MPAGGGRAGARGRAGLLAPVQSVDAAIIGFLRCILAASCIVVVFTDPGPNAHLVELAHASAFAYFVCALGIVITASKGRALPPQWLSWADIAVYTWLIALTDASENVLFLCYFFPIIVGSFAHGLQYGLALTAVSAASVLALGTVFVPGSDELAATRLLVRPGCLAVLGSLIACWGGREVRAKRELILVQALGHAPDFRGGNDAAIADALERLRGFLCAESAILLTENGASHAVHACRAPGSPVLAGPMPDAARARLLGAPDTLAVAYRRARVPRTPGSAAACDVREPSRTCAAPVEWCAGVADLLQVRAFVCVPYRERSGTSGRLYVTSERAFGSADLAFLPRFSVALAAVVDHLRVVDELASAAVERERSRISLDIHDTTIQPYIGLRMGLEALLRDVDDDSAVKDALRELVEMADLSVQDLRAYAAGLRSGPRSDGTLLAAVAEQAERYERFYGVQVGVRIDKVGLPAHLAAEVFQIITEGLSNVRRHTKANRAYVRVLHEEHTLRVDIGNDSGDESGGRAVPAFVPRSIQQRAALLGGTVSVEAGERETVVRVAVPL